jgi:cysteinyl-tRNA synthetase
MDDDFNTGAALAQLFPLATLARKSKDAQEKQHIALVCLALARLLGCLPHLTEPVSEAQGADDSAASQALEKVMELVLALRQDARQAKDFAVADRIRDGLAAAQITVRDTADGADWSL